MIDEAIPKQKIIFAALAILLGILFPFFAPYTALASEILIFALFAMAYDLVLGYAGMLSFGHAAFFGLGAYTTGIMLLRVYPFVLVGLLGGVIVSSLAAFAIGFLSIRRRGIYFTMVTLAFAQMFYFIAFKWTSMTGGDDGLQGVPRPALGPLDLSSEIALYYFILFFVVASMIIGIRLINSPFGKTLQALRENKDRAMSIGYDIDQFKLMVFVISGFFSGLAGGLYALLLNFVPLSCLYWPTSGEVVVMTIVGGMGTLFGPVLGAIAIILLRDMISNYTESWSLVMGLLFMSSVLGFRGGIMSLLRDKLKLKI
ncbi:MAG: branched-chain amino acid ABC transporter permease [Desulfobacterales bacterium]|nr:branched-chain amino acid ABC transporter permease [Desulfobacterales bacterium]